MGPHGSSPQLFNLLMQNILEHTVVTIAAIFTGVVMSDATWALLIGQVGIIAIMLVKDRRDKSNREQDRLDRIAAAQIAADSINKKGDVRKDEIIQGVKKVVVEAVTTAPTLGDAENLVHLKIDPNTNQ